MPVRSSFTAGEVLTAADLTDTFASKLDLAGGKILQIVRATDSTSRSTTSTSFVDASISVTITPQKSDSAIIILHHCLPIAPNNNFGSLAITDSSNNRINSADRFFGDFNSGSWQVPTVCIAYDTPATTSATTYKVRFRTLSGTATIDNANMTGQLYAIEVSA